MRQRARVKSALEDPLDPSGAVDGVEVQSSGTGLVDGRGSIALHQLV